MRDGLGAQQSKRRRNSPDPVRLLALRALNAVLGSHENSNEVVNRLLAGETFNRRDRSFCTALVYGCLDYLPSLDYYLDYYLKTDLASLNPNLANILRLGAWQIVYAYGVPDRAAVDESVKLAASIGLVQAKGLVNAVLRNLSRKVPEIPRRHRAISLALKPELFGLLKFWYGDEKAEAIARSYLKRPEGLCLRFKQEGQALLDQLSQVASVKLLSYFAPEGCYLEEAQSAIDQLPGYQEGLWYIQSEAAMQPAYILAGLLSAKSKDLKEPVKILDACAGLGGKTIDLAWRLAEMADQTDLFQVTSIEPNAKRYQLLEKNIERLKLSRSVRPLKQDFFSHLDSGYQAVLLDVPCSGLGVVGTRPEIKERMTYLSIKEFPDQQRAFLDRAADLVLPGGYLVYSTCTINPMENEDLVKEFLQTRPDYRPVDLSGRLPDQLDQDRYLKTRLDQGMVLLTPDQAATDGFFVAVLERMCR